MIWSALLTCETVYSGNAGRLWYAVHCWHAKLSIPSRVACSLFSVNSTTADGTKSVSFVRNGARITDSTNRLLAMGSLKDGVYTFNCTVRVPSGSPQCSGNLPHSVAQGESNIASKTNDCLVTGVSADLWHRRFDHMGEQNMRKLMNSDLVKNFAVSTQKLTFCEPCVQGMAHQQPYPEESYTRSVNILGLTHSVAHWNRNHWAERATLSRSGMIVPDLYGCASFVTRIRLSRSSATSLRNQRRAQGAKLKRWDLIVVVNTSLESTSSTWSAEESIIN